MNYIEAVNALKLKKLQYKRRSDNNGCMLERKATHEQLVSQKISFKQQDCQMKEGIENKARMFVAHKIAGMHSTITDILRIARI